MQLFTVNVSIRTTIGRTFHGIEIVLMTKIELTLAVCTDVGN